MSETHETIARVARSLDPDAAAALNGAYGDLQGRVSWSSQPFEVEVRSDSDGHTIDFLRTPAPDARLTLGGGSEAGVTYRVARGSHAIEKVTYPR